MGQFQPDDPIILSELILADSKLTDILPRTGIRIRRAFFAETVDLTDLAVHKALWLEDCRFEKDLDLNRSVFDKILSLEGSYFGGQLLMNLIGAQVIFASDIDVKDLYLTESKISGTIEIDSSFIRGVLHIDRSDIGGSLFAREASIWGVDAHGKMHHRVIFSSIGQNFEIAGSLLGDLDLTGTVVSHEFRLTGQESPPTNWAPGSTLTLSNTSIGALHDAPSSWPPLLRLNGLSVAKWGGFARRPEDEFSTRDVQWFGDWIAKDTTHSPNTYIMLAQFLRNAGQMTKAHYVLYLFRDNERAEGNTMDYVIGSISKYSVGYGYKLERGFFWFFVLVLLAYPIFRTGTLVKGSTPRSWFFFTVDSIMPLASLDEDHRKIEFAGWRQYVLYFMKMMSAILVFFVLRYIGQLLDGVL